MNKVPVDTVLEGSFSLLKEGNTFIFNRCKKFRTDIFITRLMLKRTVCVMGEEAAREFYADGRLTRQGALPPTTLRLLQDKGSVATLDGKDHQWRKQMFMSLMNRPAIEQLVDLMDDHWQASIPRWEKAADINFLREVELILCATVCQWAGIPGDQVDVQQRTKEISAMIDGAGSLTLRTWRGLILRAKTENWIRKLIDQVRAGTLTPSLGSALDIIARHKDQQGNLLSTQTAGVELINILRPTLAIGRYILFAALALHRFPECRAKLQSEDAEYVHCFVQEVRRYYPFFPFVAGLVKEEFTWRGYQFKKGIRVMLDLYGTTHDPRTWQEPNTFNPGRFRHQQGGAFALIPQGGGDFGVNHRCAGEWITIEIIKRAVLLLTHSMDYKIRPGDYSIDLSRMPAQPKDAFTLFDVKRRKF